MYDPHLGAAFAFDQADLVANEQGRLSDRQATMVQEAVVQRRRMGVVGAVVIVGSIGAVGAFGLQELREADTRTVVDAGLVGAEEAFALVGGIVLALLVVAVLLGRRRSRDVRAGRLSSVHGPVSTEVIQGWTDEDGRRIPRYVLSVGERDFLVASQAQLDCFVDGQAHVVHYLRDAGTPWILSVRRG